MAERKIGPVEASILRLKAMRVARGEQKNREAAKASRIEQLKQDVAKVAARKPKPSKKRAKKRTRGGKP